MDAGGGGSGGLFSPENRPQLEASFKAFLARPQNRPLVEQQQAEEVHAALSLQEQARDAELQAQVSALSADQQKRLAPFLAYPVLRRLVQSLTNQQPAGSQRADGSPAGAVASLAEWADNPRVLAMLKSARSLLRQGRLTEQQLEQLMLASVRAQPDGEAAQQLEAALPNHVVLPSAMLVEALNEHLLERRAGNQAFQGRRLPEALHAYSRALAIVEFVRGSNADDQAEVDQNKATTLLNMAAVHLALEEWGAAVTKCDAVLAINPTDAKAVLRRAKANIGRHEYQAAQRDIAALQQLDPWCAELGALQLSLLTGQRTRQQERQLAEKMLRGLSMG